MDIQFQRIYNLIKNDILRLTYVYTKNISDAEDVTQEVFIKLYENMNKFVKETDENIKKWCVKVAVNKCKNLYFSSWKKKICLFLEFKTNKSSQTNNLCEDLNECLFKLSEKYRVVLVLYYYEGYKIQEISTILNLNESTVKQQLKRGKEQLEKLLIKEEDYGFQGKHC